MKFPLFLLVWLMLLTGARAAEGAPAPARAVVLALVERQAHAWEQGDEAGFLATVADDLVFAYPGKRLGKEGVLKTFRDWKRDFRDTTMRVSHVVIEGGRFSVEYTFATTNKATGVRTAVGTIATGEVRGGRIVVWKEYLDGRVSRAQAKGELPVDEQAEPFPWPDTPESRVP